MSTEAIAATLRAAADRGIRFHVEDGALRTRAPKGAIDAELAAFIGANKAGIVALLAQTAAAGHRRGPTPRARGAAGDPLSLAQERFWFIDRLTGDGAQYNMPIALRIRGDFKADVAEQALQRIVERHGPLHSVIVDDPALGLLQRARDDVRFALERVDVADLAPDAQEARIRECMLANAHRAFDLARDLMLRGTFIRVGDRDSVLLLCTPHIASDGWSFLVMEKEFVAWYGAIEHGRPAPFGPLAVTYADYAQWQRERLREPSVERQLAWWEDRLRDAPAAHGLPLDRPRAADLPHRAGWHDFRVERALYADLKRLALERGSTLFMVLHAAFALLLSRHSGSDDIVVGTPVLNRLERELEPLIGCFVNTLALRVDCDAAQTFTELLQQVKAVNLDAQANQEITFGQVVERVRPARSLLHTPVFQIMFSMGMPKEAAHRKADGPQLTPLKYEGATAKFEISFYAQEHEGDLQFGVEYDADLFDAATIVRMFAQWQRLLRAIAADPVRPLSHYALLDAAEQKSVVDAWCDGGTAPVEAICLGARFERQARLTPDAPAFVCDGTVLTYAQLDARAERLARHLHRGGVGPDVPVGLCAERSIGLGVAILAVWKAGGAYVALDPAQPPARLAQLLDDAGAPWLIGDRAAIESFAGDARTFALEDLDALPDGEAFTATVTPSNLAYVIFTSGSTGRPKGVLIEHRHAVNLAQNLRTLLAGSGVPGDCRWAWNASFAFDASLKALLAWGDGACLHLLSADTRRDPTLLLDYLKTHRIDVLDATPLQIESLLQRAGDDTDLPVLVIGGEAIGVDLWQRIAALPRVSLNVYGPTEATVDATCARIEGTRPTIGRPLVNVRCYVLDAHGAVQPEGVPGELCIAGAGVGRGYLNRPELTAERFVEIDVAGRTERVYRTGDIARWIGGQLDYLGRRDGQVKIRGFRIETEEVAHPLRGMSGVAAAVVVARNERLVGYVVPDAPATAAPPWLDRLSAQLRTLLPEYMVPSQLVALDALPVTANGKLDHAALPAPDTTDARCPYVAPASDTEKALAAIWAELFHIDASSVSAAANFFALGGHSLLLMRMISAIRHALGVDVPVKSLFDAADLRASAAVVDRIGAASTPRARLVARTRERPECALSLAQERFWFVDRLTGDGAQYNIPTALRVAGDFDADIAERALQRIVERHAPLHSVVVDDPARGLVQRPRGDTRFALAREDLADLPDDARHARVQAALRANADAPFDLASDLMLRGTWLRLSARDGVLLLCTPHIAADGWSLRVMQHEFAAAYQAMRRGAPDPLAPLRVVYADYVDWQRERQREPDAQGRLDKWVRRLSGLPAVHGLPLDRPRAQGGAHRAGWHEFGADRALYADLRRLALEHGCTLFMVLHAAFAWLLSRHSGSDDIVVGTPVMNRLERELEPLIGCFVNTLALRVDCGAAQTFAELLGQVKAVNLDAQANQETPFEQIVERLRPERNVLHAPLFQIMFSMGLTSRPADAWRPDGLEFSPIDHPNARAKFELSLFAQESGDDLRFGVEYDADLFDAGTIARMFAQWQRLLHAIAADAARPLSRYALLDANEQQRIVDEWSDGGAAPIEPICLHARVERQARLTPDAPALVCEGTVLTYAQLDARAERLARHLHRGGVGPDVLVGVCAARSADLAVALLAVWKAGGAYVALDPAQPPARLAQLLDDAGAPWLIGDRVSIESFAGDARTFALEDLDALPDGEAFVATVTPSNLAYVIFTSGSTGRPKGVLIEHRHAVNLAQDLRARLADLGVPPDGRWAWNASFAFDASLQALLAWGDGACLHLLSADTRRDPALLLDYLKTHRIDVLDATPLQIESLLQRAGDDTDMPVLVIGGEAIGVDLWQRIAALPRGALNVYGPTETTVDATCARIEGTRPTIGRPLANVRCYVLDAHGAVQPEGVPGELYIAGAGVARGYLNRPELTAERFVEIDVAGRTERVYRTGDIARWIDGQLDYLGRRDGQVKIRGYRIEVEEVAQQLRRLHGVAAAVVTVRNDSLVGYVVALTVASDEWLDALGAQLRTVLPEYMVPSHLVALDALPVTANGKLDHAALPAPDTSDTRRPYVAPASDTEKALAAIWAELFHIDASSVSAAANFFALGGHSLLLMRMISAIRHALDVDVPLKALFDAADLRACAGIVDAAEQGRRLKLAPRGDTAATPLSLAQERFWFIDRLTGDGAQYNMPVALRIGGDFDADVAERALQRIVERHAPLHSVVVADAGVVTLRPLGDVRFALARVDLADLPADAQRERVSEAMRAHAGASFDLASDLMLRGAWLRLSARDGVLLLCLPHFAADGWSLRVMADEFGASYEALRAGRTDPLAPLAITYGDYAHWQRERAREPAAERQLAYWENQLRDAPAVHGLPLDRPRIERLRRRAGRCDVVVGADVHAGLAHLARAHNATMFMVLHAAFAWLLSRHSGSDDIVVGTPVMNRLERELEPLIGCFVNTLALRVDCGSAQTFAELLGQVKAVNLDAQANQETTFEQVVERVRPSRSLLHTPLFQIMFAMGMPADATPRRLTELTLTPLDHAGATSKFELSLFAQEHADGLAFAVVYDADLFDAGTIARMFAQWQRLLHAIAADAARPLSRYALLDAGETKRIVESWSDGGAAPVEAICLHARVERQARLTPDAPALVCEGTVLTYAQLDARAERLARHLHRGGVGPDVLVGVCAARSADLAVALLAVWKAGGAYVALDPAQPPARLAQLLDDAGAPWLIGDRVSIESFAGDARTFALEDLDALPDGEAFVATVTPSNLAYVIFTSGSTGRPKGVLIEHRHAVNLAQDLRARLADLGVPHDGRWAWNASFAFDASLQALLAWGDGACLHLLSADTRRDPALLLDYLKTHRIDVLDATPLQIESLLQRAGDDTDLPVLVIGGEAIGVDLWQRIAALPRGALNVYGPTETTVDATCARIEGTRPTIGRPLANVRCYVLDAHGAVQPEGVPGELCIAGAGVARGYLNRPELTAERFVEIDVAGRTERVYRTGDIARWIDGQLDYLGRRDGQVKIRGYRIEVEEVAQQLRRLHGVAAAVVTVRNDSLVGYVVALTVASDEWLDALGAQLRTVLPEYMVPSHLVALDALPVTANGKLDHAALPAPQRRYAPRRAPVRAAERYVAQVWQDQLGVDGVGLDDDFFALGGQSLLAVRVASRLESAFRVPLPLRAFFAHPNVAGLVALLDRAAGPATCDAVAQAYLDVAALDADTVQALLAEEDTGSRNTDHVRAGASSDSFEL
ncbi:non-ribosomal peptide synthetase [Tahibacter soli]|uniref:Amino acid adenylation domain-containing protein n=1 Tax=Tahibacter soli TaxID=2983605 RepID=A0A9X3YPS3_9GAMM|nr:non-ribosomal peptide synthetase [Tahibacter soli]MDC8016149.1 amino acid adenylation domain-containing protein [Tahibacter soli]